MCLLNIYFPTTTTEKNRIQNPAGKAMPSFYAGSEVSFRVVMSLDTSQLEQGMHMVARQQVWLRLKLCDASWTPLCVPLSATLESKKHNETFGSAKEEDFSKQGAHAKELPFDQLFSPFSLHSLADDALNDSTTLKISTVIKYTIPKVLGPHNLIGHGVVFLAPNATDMNTASMELDIANILQPRVYTIKTPPIILQPTPGYEISTSVLLGAAGLFEICLLVGVITFRENLVLKLSQPPFLILLLVCSLAATAACVFYIPKNDVYCNLSSPLTTIPLSMIASILIARGWRIYMILSSALRLSLASSSKRRVYEERFMYALTILASWQDLLGEPHIRRQRSSKRLQRRRQSLSSRQHALRKEVKDWQVLQLICSLTLPQVIIQIIILVQYPYQVEIENGESSSREICISGHWWPTCAGILIIFVLFFMAVFVAYICRDLPSLFNEKKQIFKASSINFVVLVFAAAMVALTDFETSSPNSRAFLWTGIILCLVLTPCFLIILPKVNRARKGEIVVMSSLFGAPSVPAINSPSSLTVVQRPAACLNQARRGSSSSELFLEEPLSTKVDPLKPMELPTIVVRQNHPPPRQLELRLLATKDLINNVSESSSEGRGISKHEWQLLQHSVLALSSRLQQLEFGWEDENEESSSQKHHSQLNIDVFCDD